LKKARATGNERLLDPLWIAPDSHLVRLASPRGAGHHVIASDRPEKDAWIEVQIVAGRP
jgi:hypothetical protein